MPNAKLRLFMYKQIVYKIHTLLRYYRKIEMKQQKYEHSLEKNYTQQKCDMNDFVDADTIYTYSIQLTITIDR